jgi:hypothetical protein
MSGCGANSPCVSGHCLSNNRGPLLLLEAMWAREVCAQRSAVISVTAFVLIWEGQEESEESGAVVWMHHMQSVVARP